MEHASDIVLVYAIIIDENRRKQLRRQLPSSWFMVELATDKNLNEQRIFADQSNRSSATIHQW